jgi:D-aspartate ligase
MDAPRTPRVGVGGARGALVVGGDYRGLGVVRSLGRRGIRVWVLTDGDDVLATRSRYCAHHLRLLGHSNAEQSAFLRQLADEHALDGFTLFPTSDRTAAAIAQDHAALAERYVLTTPSWKTLRWAFDKRRTYELAERLDVAYPRTWTAGSAQEASELAVEFPVVIKPAVREEDNALTVAKAWRADDVCELRARFAEGAELLPPAELLIQELVPGGGESQFSYAALCEEGAPIATVIARRTRQYPADFGRASTFVETVEQPEIEAGSERLLAELRFSGLVEIEFKRHPASGVFKLLDINPRVWGWHSLCGRAGVDFPYLAWQLARGEPVAAARGKTGVRWVRHSTDIPTSLREILRHRLSAREYLTTLRGPVENAIFARDDPKPGLYEYPMLVSTLARRLTQGREV